MDERGIRGVVVDRFGSIITRAAFAALLQRIGQGLETTLNNQTIREDVQGRKQQDYF